MTDNTSQAGDVTKLVDSWMNIASSFWQYMKDGSERSAEKSSLDEDNVAPGSTVDSDDDERFKTYRAWETSVGNFTTFLKLLNAPENQEALVKSANAYAEALVQATADSMENVAEFQAQLLQSFAKVGEHTTAHNLDELDHRAFESFRDLYKSELQKYLYIPKVGLPRQSHEQMSRLVDSANIFFSHLGELIYLFLVPFEKTNRSLQQKTRQMLERGEFVEDAKQAYNEWIKTLESHYEALLRSREYTLVLDNTISSLSAYKSAKHEVINEYLKELQIPTNKEMNEVYRDLYQTKKKLAELTRQVAQLQADLKTLSK